MGKQTRNRQWIIFAEYYGGPCDGETIELTVNGPDPVRAFVSHVERDDIPERLQKQNHWYEIEWTSLVEFSCGEDGEDAAAAVSWVYEGMRG